MSDIVYIRISIIKISAIRGFKNLEIYYIIILRILVIQ